MKNAESNMNHDEKNNSNNGIEKNIILEAYMSPVDGSSKWFSWGGREGRLRKDEDKWNIEQRNKELNTHIIKFLEGKEIENGKEIKIIKKWENPFPNAFKLDNAKIAGSNKFPAAFDFSSIFKFDGVEGNGDIPNLRYTFDATISDATKIKAIFGAKDGFCRRSVYTSRLANLGIVDTTYINAGNRSNDEKAVIRSSGEYIIIPNAANKDIEPNNAEIYAQLIIDFNRLSFIQVGGADSDIEINEKNPNYVNHIDGEVYLDFSNDKGKLNSLNLENRTKIGTISYYPDRDESQTPKSWKEENKSRLSKTREIIRQGSTAAGAAEMIKGAITNYFSNRSKGKTLQTEKIKVKFDLSDYSILNTKGTDEDNFSKDTNKAKNKDIEKLSELEKTLSKKCKGPFNNKKFKLIATNLINIENKHICLVFTTVKVTEKDKDNENIEFIPFEADESYYLNGKFESGNQLKDTLLKISSKTSSNESIKYVSNINNVILEKYMNFIFEDDEDESKNNSENGTSNDKSDNANNDEIIWLSRYTILAYKFFIKEVNNDIEFNNISMLPNEGSNIDIVKNYLYANENIDKNVMMKNFTNMNIDKAISGIDKFSEAIIGKINSINEKTIFSEWPKKYVKYDEEKEKASLKNKNKTTLNVVISDVETQINEFFASSDDIEVSRIIVKLKNINEQYIQNGNLSDIEDFSDINKQINRITSIDIKKADTLCDEFEKLKTIIDIIKEKNNMSSSKSKTETSNNKTGDNKESNASDESDKNTNDSNSNKSNDDSNTDDKKENSTPTDNQESNANETDENQNKPKDDTSDQKSSDNETKDKDSSKK